MWHSIVSNLDIAINRLIGGFVATCHDYPVATMCSLATFAVLTIALWLDLLRLRRSGNSGADHPAPIRLKR